LADYSLKDLYFNLKLENRPEYAQIYGNFQSIMFHDQVINKQGAVDLDIKEIIKDDSRAAVDFQSHYNNELLRDEFARQNRYKRIEDFFF